MNIGVITWFDGPNYGTVLQAIALQKYLRIIGNEVKLLNWMPPHTERRQKESFWQKVARQPLKYANLYAEEKYGRLIEQKNTKLKSAIRKNCEFTDPIVDEDHFIETCNRFDLLICGSDQIWNPNWYHRMYYADDAHIKVKRISYAPSLGVTEIESETAEKIRRSLRGFSQISVRERQGAELLEKATGIRPEVVVDPTLLLEADDWDAFLKNDTGIRDDYVLSMFLTDNHHHWLAANRFAMEQKMKHVIIPYTGFSYLQPGEICADAGIEELLTLIKNARYVLTDSFHITVFSLIFQRQFYSIMRFKENGYVSQNSRLVDLLVMAGLKDRGIPYNTNRIRPLQSIDYSSVQMALKREIERSKAFLIKAIEPTLNLSHE